MGLGFVPQLVIWRYDNLLPSALVLFVEAGLSLGVEGELPASCVGTSCRGDCVRAEVSRRQGSDDGGQVWPAHREVAGENLSEALFELSLDEFNKGGRHILLGCCLGLGA